LLRLDSGSHEPPANAISTRSPGVYHFTRQRIFTLAETQERQSQESEASRKEPLGPGAALRSPARVTEARQRGAPGLGAAVRSPAREPEASQGGFQAAEAPHSERPASGLAGQ